MVADHSKEHCLVGVKRPPPAPTTTALPSFSTTSPRSPTSLDEEQLSELLSNVKRGLDADVIVAEVRETSRKPDEVYEMIERCCPSSSTSTTTRSGAVEGEPRKARKLELFGRGYNFRPGWCAPLLSLFREHSH